MTDSHEHHSSPMQPEVLQGEEFLVPQTEVKEMPPTNEEKLLELLSPPPEKLDELYERLGEVTERALATTVNLHNQEALLVTSNIIGWRLFAAPGSRLPFGLVHGKDKDETYSTSVLYDTRTDFGVKCIEEATAKLYAAGYSEIYDELVALMDEREPQIKEVFASSIEASQTFQFINALATDKPAQSEQQPLTPFWRAIREAQIDQTVRTRWGLEPQEQIIPYTEPDYDLRKELSKLDDETSPALTKPKDDPMARLRSYLGELVRAQYTKANPEEGPASLVSEDDGSVYIHTEKGGYNDPDDWIQAAAHELTMQINEAGPHIQVMTEEWIYSLTESILWPKEEQQDFQQLSKRAIDEAWDYLDSDVQLSRTFASDNYSPPTGRKGIIHAGLVRPGSAYIDLSQLPEDRSHSHNHYSHSRAEINALTDKYFGEVLRFSLYTRGQHAHRLIQSEPKRDDLPPLNGNEELVLRLFNEFEHTQPYIPGYRLVGISQDMYGFVSDPMGDPYTSADILLTPEQRHNLAARYTEIGLSKLARKLERRSEMTVQDLTSLIEKQSKYATTKKAKAITPPLQSDTWEN